MMYISLLVIPVPAENHETYLVWARQSADIFKRYGCIDVLDAWEDFVPEGRQTDYRQAVAAKPGEKIAVSWQIWPDRESLYAAETKMHADGVLDSLGDAPFDGSRLIVGCFSSIPSHA